MAEPSPSARENLEGDFQDYEKDIRVRNYRMCGVLAMAFMLIGSTLDWIVYGEAGVRDFIGIRLGTAIVLGIIRVLLGREWGRKFHRPLGIAMAMPLIVSMAWMIYARNGSESPYYAGLNLVMLGAAVLMHWQLADSIIIVFLTLASYFIACFANDQPINRAVFFNNVYFLFVTGVFTTAGTWFYNTIRFSEFQLRNDLDKNRSELESANLKLADNYAKLRDLDEAKNRFFANISHELAHAFDPADRSAGATDAEGRPAQRGRSARPAGHHAGQCHAIAEADQRPPGTDPLAVREGQRQNASPQCARFLRRHGQCGSGRRP